MNKDVEPIEDSSPVVTDITEQVQKRTFHVYSILWQAA